MFTQNYLGTFVPRKEVEVIETVSAIIINPNQALRLRARVETTDRDGIARVTGEEWLVKKIGAYLPGAYEEMVDMVNAYILTEKVRLILYEFNFEILNDKKKIIVLNT